MAGVSGCVVGVHDVADDRRLSLRVAQLVAARVGHDPGPVVVEPRVDDEQVAARVGAGITEPVVLDVDVVDHGVARVALADVDAGIGAPGGVGVLEQAIHRVEGVEPVVAVAVGRQVRAAVTVDACPEEAVERVVAGGHVLHRHATRAEDANPVVELELAIEDHLVAVQAADRQFRRRHVDGLVVHTGRDEDEVAGGGGIDGVLDRRVIGRHLDRRPVCRGGSRCGGTGRRGRQRCQRGEDSDDGDDGAGGGAHTS